MCAGFGQQLPDQFLRLVVVSLSKMMAAYMPLRINEIMRRPVLIVEGLPDGVVVIEGHRIFNPEVAHGTLYITFVLLECEFRRVNPEHDQSVILVLFIPARHVRQGTQAIDAGIGPEVDQDDLASQGLGHERCGIQP